jgi:hypothetical protein
VIKEPQALVCCTDSTSAFALEAAKLVLFTLKKMFISVNSFSFTPYKDGGFVSVKATNKDAVVQQGFPSDLRLKVYAKNRATVLEYLTILTEKEIVDIVVVGQHKQNQWEIENSMPLTYDFRFNVFPPMFANISR